MLSPRRTLRRELPFGYIFVLICSLSSRILRNTRCPKTVIRSAQGVFTQSQTWNVTHEILEKFQSLASRYVVTPPLCGGRQFQIALNINQLIQ